MINRREFIQSLIAAAAVANVPFGEADAAAIVDQFEHGIEEWPNGWFRVWVTRKQPEAMFSCYMKAGTENWASLRIDRFRVWVDLKTGRIGRSEVVDTDKKYAIEISDGYLWGAQLEGKA